jgi:hypothetical protein
MLAISSFAKSPRHTKFESQERGEKIVFLLRKHFAVNAPWLVLGVFFLIFPTLFKVISASSVFSLLPERYALVGKLFWYLSIFSFILKNYLVWYFSVYLITNKRVVDIDFFGLLHKRTSEAPLRNIEDVTYNVGGIPQILFGYGDVLIQTAAEKREFEFESIPRPDIVHDKLTDMVNAATRGGRRKSLNGRRK